MNNGNGNGQGLLGRFSSGSWQRRRFRSPMANARSGAVFIHLQRAQLYGNTSCYFSQNSDCKVFKNAILESLKSQQYHARVWAMLTGDIVPCVARTRHTDANMAFLKQNNVAAGRIVICYRFVDEVEGP
jgi:hypothetical protein